MAVVNSTTSLEDGYMAIEAPRRVPRRKRGAAKMEVEIRGGLDGEW